MGEKDKRPIYKPPRARDLSASTVSGFPQPKGICAPGTNLVYPEECANGPSPFRGVGTCDPVGLGPGFGKCTQGNAAIEGCRSGGAP